MAYETIVVGAGLAGLVGAVRLATAGQRVLLLAKGYGTTHWAAGTLGVAAGATPAAGFAQLAAQPEHPYRLVPPAALIAAIDLLQAECAAAGYPLLGSLDAQTELTTALGASLPAAYFPVTMAAGAWTPATRQEPVLIAGFPQLRDFFPTLVAANLQQQGFSARACWLELPPVRNRVHNFTPTVLAELFEQPDFRVAVGRQLRAVRGDAMRIGLPAVLGLGQATTVVQELAAQAGVPIFEIPTLPPSVPGIRLARILTSAFTRAGGRLQLGGWVVRAEGANGHLTQLYSEAAAREQRHTMDAVLLATGGIAGGGLRAAQSGQVHETALGLPVQVPASRAAWFAPNFTDAHPIHRAGIATDAKFRPISAAGTPLYDNVVVAGAALGGADLIREGAYEGVALATGWLAAGTLLGQAAPASTSVTSEENA